MNFILALVLYLIISFQVGVPNQSSNKIGSITKDFPAESVLVSNNGNTYTINKGDRITIVGKSSTDYEKVDSWKDFSNYLDDIYDSYHTTVYVGTNKIEGLKDSTNNQLLFEV